MTGFDDTMALMELLKSDIFFVVTSISVVAVTLLICVALVHLIGILRDARKLSSKARLEGEAILEDVGAIREKTKEGVFSFLKKITNHIKSSKSKKK